jgi:hypothetical protein
MNPRAVDSTTASAGADARQKTQDALDRCIHPECSQRVCSGTDRRSNEFCYNTLPVDRRTETNMKPLTRRLFNTAVVVVAPCGAATAQGTRKLERTIR